MAEVLLYHHIQGLTDGVRAFADELRRAGHTVHIPDLFEGRTFATIEEGFGFAREAGFDAIRERGTAAADQFAPGLVYAGFSFGVTIAQRLAQTRPGARGALLMESCMPVTEYGDAWPQGVPVQIHGKEGDEFFDEDLPAARELADSTPAAELFIYPGDQHLFTDSSLDAYDPQAAALLMQRVQAFLAKERSDEYSPGSLGHKMAYLSMVDLVGQASQSRMVTVCQGSRNIQHLSPRDPKSQGARKLARWHRGASGGPAMENEMFSIAGDFVFRPRRRTGASWNWGGNQIHQEGAVAVDSAGQRKGNVLSVFTVRISTKLCA